MPAFFNKQSLHQVLAIVLLLSVYATNTAFAASRRIPSGRLNRNAAPANVLSTSALSHGQCEVSDHDKIDCHRHSVQDCERENCCWKPSSSGGVPWCYHKHRIVEPQCVVAEPLRIDCARFNERECSAVGCCWVPTKHRGAPWCFKPASEPSTPTQPSPEPEKPNRPTPTLPDPPCPTADPPLPTSTSTSTATSTSTPAPTYTPSPSVPPLSGGQCGNWENMDNCQASFHDYGYPDNVEARRWQTPPRGSSGYKPSYQDYRDIQGYASVTYTPSRLRAHVKINVVTRVSPTVLIYRFAATSEATSRDSGVDMYQLTTDNTFTVDHDFKDSLSVVVFAPHLNNATLVLDPIDFVWNNPTIHAPQTENGQKGAIVEMFGWPHRDVEKECEFLGKAGYMGVKIFPPNEHVSSDYWLVDNNYNPWYFIYQPVSYRLHSRMGTREELRSMIQTCRKHNVRVYADVVNNHMSGNGNDILNHRRHNCVSWGGKNSSANSPYFTHGWTYELNPHTKNRPALEYPAVPYGPSDFHCEQSVNSWGDPVKLNAGWLSGLSDLNTGKQYVRERIADYWVDLMGIGFSGIRVDAAKHIRPDDLAAIFGIFLKKMGGHLPADFIAWLEVIIGGEKDLLACQENSYDFYGYLTKALASHGLSKEDIDKIKIWSSDYPREHPVCGRWVLPSTRFVIQNDDHDQQFGGTSRDLGDEGSVLVRERNVAKHRQANVRLFTRRDGDWKIRLVLSGFTLSTAGDPHSMGFPDGNSECSKFRGTNRQYCRSVAYSKAHNDQVCGYTVNNFEPGQYTRTHRDKSVIMAMREWMGLKSHGLSNTDIGLPNHC